MRIGIIGGGQLGMMMIEAAHEMGIEAYALDPNPLCSCRQVADKLVIAPYDDLEALEGMCKECDVVTYEFENVSSEAISRLEGRYSIPQGTNILRVCQNRFLEKDFARKAGFETAKYARINSMDDIKKAIQTIGLPAILKTTSGGYDGKGQWVLKTQDDLSKISFDKELIYEEMIPFDFEVSMIGARNKQDQMVLYPLFKNTHKDGILRLTEFLGNDSLQARLSPIMERYMHLLDYQGVLCVELFVKGNEVLFNEMAPRPHNSGHLTIEAMNASQYANHVLGILNKDLIKPVLIHDCQMVNLLGEQYLKKEEILKECPSLVLHDYFKDQVKPLRKMGHITFVDCPKELREAIIKKYF